MSYFLIPCNFFSRLISCLRNRTDPVSLRSSYGLCATNLRSSAFICGSFFAEAPEIKSSIRKRTRMTQIKRIFTDFPIRVNPRHPRNPCSTSASLFAAAPYSKDSDRINRMDRINQSTNPVNPVHPVQSGSSFSAAPDINCSEFIKAWTSQNSRR